ncbi:reverse transcriptase domain-containing protein [Tanacetum coccineum]
MSQSNQQVNVVNLSCETCGGPHHYSECQAADGFTQEDVYAVTRNYNARGGGTRPVDNHGPSAHFKFRKHVPSPVIQPALASKSNEILERNPHQPPIPYPSRLNKDKLQDKSDIQITKFLKIFKKLHFNISLEKLLELANTPLNENCSTVLFDKLSKKLGDPGKFLIPCYFKEIKVDKFTFQADFVVVDYDVDPRVPLILGRPFLRTACALVDVYGEELTLRVGDEKLIFNVESTSKYPHKHGDKSINQIDIIDTKCEEHFHEVLNVQKLIHPFSGSPTPSSDPVVASLPPSLTPFGIVSFFWKRPTPFLL